MLAYIKGMLEMKFNNYIVIDVGGIGYKIFMSENAIETIGETGKIVKVHTHYRVREDDISIYGFLTNDELKMFELLIGVSGIGAKSAITMLSNITPSSFALAIISNDTSKLVKIPGIGAKSAARIVLELKDKLKTTEAVKTQNTQIQQVIIEDNKIQEAISALQVLGYNRKEIEKVLEKLDKTELSLEDIIRNSLTILGK
ncbi:MAG: Holliday junction branch migration protein RuvA [Clostridia bacterium]|jgi:Holliday junction DNA helicase RuvA|nr:Holliday junction branch migration protein RuvA [Clostridia bacterium]